MEFIGIIPEKFRKEISQKTHQKVLQEFVQRKNKELPEKILTGSKYYFLQKDINGHT